MGKWLYCILSMLFSNGEDKAFIKSDAFHEKLV